MCALPNRQHLGTSESGRRPKARKRAPRNLRFRGGPRDGTWRAKAGDPPELAQDNPPPWPGGSALSLLKLIPPGLVVAVLAVLIFSLVFYALLPYRRRAYVPILVTTAAGFAL